MSIYYKHIELSNVEEIANQILDVIPIEHRQQTDFRDVKVSKLKEIELLWTELYKLNLFKEDLKSAFVITLSPNSELPIHTDDGCNAESALNWPLKGCKGTYTRFFLPATNESEPEITFTTDGRRYVVWKPESVIEVDRVEWNNNPVTLDVRALHSVSNPNLSLRVTVSLRFAKPILT